MTRRTMAERKRRTDDRATRRDSLLVLLSRIARGIPVTAAEATLLRAHVEVELTESDELRRTIGGQQTAMQRERKRVDAAEAAIVEAEQRAEQAEELLSIAHQASNEAERHKATAERDAGIYRTRLETLTAAHVKQRRQAEAALDRVRQADTLGAALAAVAEYDGLTPQAAATQAAITDRANAPEQQLDEQAREHAVALAKVERRANVAEQALARIRGARTWVEVWTTLGMHYNLRPEQCGQEARARRTVDERAAHARADEAEQQLAAQMRRANGWRTQALEADARGDRYRNAWRSARRWANEHQAEHKRVRGWLEHWADRARAAEKRLADAPIPYALTPAAGACGCGQARAHLETSKCQ
ncbi:hypothetical protein ACOKM5_24320 [Streptomyces sp. BH097]|uniref:hypothetical protein n=1 Tax=Streptomyces sp. BH097 TaxID=3410406 RepID=UPI003CE8E554